MQDILVFTIRWQEQKLPVHNTDAMCNCQKGVITEERAIKMSSALETIVPGSHTVVHVKFIDDVEVYDYMEIIDENGIIIYTDKHNAEIRDQESS